MRTSLRRRPAQFPSHPSSQLLANQTRFLVIKDGDLLVRILDGVTRTLAEAYTERDEARAKRTFAAAAADIERYIGEVKAFAARGDMPPETESLLVTQATTLIELVHHAAM